MKSIRSTFLVVSTVLGVLVISVWYALAQDMLQETSSTPTREHFPLSRYCEHSSIGTGPEWFGLGIGASFDDIIPHQAGAITLYSTNNFQILWPQTDPYTDISILGCYKGNKITLIMFYIESYKRLFADFVLHYGIPDTVTYASYGRLAFWFDYGLAVEIQLTQTGNYNDGIVEKVILFPYQSLPEAMTQWPYLYTPIVSQHDKLAGDVIYESRESLQNPFDFPAIFATATAQAVVTPTSVFTPTFVPTPTLSMPSISNDR